MGIEIRLNQVEDYVGLMEIENSVWNDENTPFVHVYENVIEYQYVTQLAVCSWQLTAKKYWV